MVHGSAENERDSVFFANLSLPQRNGILKVLTAPNLKSSIKNLK